MSDNHILPFLWVHGEDEATYRKMVDVIYNASIRAFCVEARPHKDFCGEKWWRDMGIILDEAEKRGMKVWILDDRHFPTGFANGAAEKAPSELRRQGLLHKTFSVKKGNIRLNANRAAHPPRLPSATYVLTNIYNRNRERFSDDRLLGVSAVRLDEPDAPISLGGFIHNGVLEWSAPDGEWEIHVTYLTRNIGSHRSYINMMDKDSCRLQIDAVYEPHYAHFGDKFGTVIAGFFSDEPELGNNSMYKMENPLGTEQDLPWSRELEAAMAEQLGDGYAALLPLLWTNCGDVSLTAKVRFTYMDAVSRLVEEDFSRQIGDWCRRHGVEYIGHVVEDNNQHARTGTSLGHYFRGLKWQSMAGIDDIGGQVEPGCEDRRIKSPLGFTSDGEFFHYALGKLGSSLGALNPNMQGRTVCEIFGNYGWLEGVRLEKYLLDHFMVRGVNHFVPHAFTCSPYPDRDCPPHFYAQGNNPQYRHFGELMKYADRVCGLISGGAAVTPVAILYHGEAEWSGKCMLMQKPARVCLDNQVDFCFIPADAFSERDFYRTEITDRLRINGRAFSELIVPYSQFITPATAQALRELTEKGGKVIFIDALPDGLTDGEPLPVWLRNIPAVPLKNLLNEIEALRTVALDPPNDRIRALHYHGIENLVYLVNEGNSCYEGTVRLPIDIPVCIYDAWLDRYEEITCAGDGVKVKLHPNHSIIFLPKDNKTVASPIVMAGEKVPLEKFGISACKSADYPHFGVPKTVERLEPFSRSNPKFSGYIRYETSFEYSGNGLAGLEITDAREGVEVFVNGRSAGIQIVPPFRYDLTKLCEKGNNALSVEVATTLERERRTKKSFAPTGIIGNVYLFMEHYDEE